MNVSEDTLRVKLQELDRKSYKTYKSIQGSTAVFSAFKLFVDHVQSDPFAEPSRFRVEISQSIAGFPKNLTQNRIRRIALADALCRQFHIKSKEVRKRRGTGKSGLIEIAAPGQSVLARSAARIDDTELEVRFSVGLPARGRAISAQQAISLIFEDLVKIIAESLYYEAFQSDTLQNFVYTVEDAEALRAQLRENRCIAFVGNGATLARRSGIDDTMLREKALSFRSPESFALTLNRPNHGPITGMGIPEGITLIVGGGYHGKSTLLRAIAAGIYNHPPGDGREWVVSDPNTVKIRAEEGRFVASVNISPFINNLPTGIDTGSFSTENASGSTSMAANIIEAVEVGAQVLLIDEDTAASNFMGRDARMQALISKDKEPITPYIDKVQSLYSERRISTLLVMGGSGDYFEVADQVIGMNNFEAYDLSQAAKDIVKQHGVITSPAKKLPFGALNARSPQPLRNQPWSSQYGFKIKTPVKETIIFGNARIDLSAIEQLAERTQTRAIAYALSYAVKNYFDDAQDIAMVGEKLTELIRQKNGFDFLSGSRYGDLSEFRIFEWSAALNRLRTLVFNIKGSAGASTS